MDWYYIALIGIPITYWLTSRLFVKSPKYCSICNIKLSLKRYVPKPKWNVQGHLCKDCWNKQEIKFSGQ